MSWEFLKKINWVDILVILIFLRTLYIGLKRGFIVEFFKLLGVLFAVVIPFHYYTRIADFLNSKSPLPLDFADFVSLLFLSTVIILIFKFIRDGFFVLIKAETHPFLDRWAGAILSTLRASLLSSLIIILVFSTSLTYLKNSVKDSFSQGYLLNLAPRLYSSCFENIMSKFFTGEQLNTAIFDSLELSQKQ